MMMSSPVQKVLENLSLVKLIVGWGIITIEISSESVKHPPTKSWNTRT